MTLTLNCGQGVISIPEQVLIALILGPLVETNMRQAITSASSSSILVTRPVSAAILAVAVVVFFAPLVNRLIIGRPRPASAVPNDSVSVGPK